MAEVGGIVLLENRMFAKKPYYNKGLSANKKHFWRDFYFAWLTQVQVVQIT